MNNSFGLVLDLNDLIETLGKKTTEKPRRI